MYNYRKAFPDFDQKWIEAKQAYVERLEAESDRRAVEGYDQPVFYKGEQCGTTKKYSDSLLMFRLKAEAPDKYRERVDTDVSIKDIVPVINISLSDTGQMLDPEVEPLDNQTGKRNALPSSTHPRQKQPLNDYDHCDDDDRYYGDDDNYLDDLKER